MYITVKIKTYLWEIKVKSKIEKPFQTQREVITSVLKERDRKKIFIMLIYSK